MHDESAFHISLHKDTLYKAECQVSLCEVILIGCRLKKKKEKMNQDLVDSLIQQWSIERPDLNASAMGVVGRILRLAAGLQRRGEESLAPFNLSMWQFDVLATLRRAGAPFRLSPTQLMRAVMLTSGAMTNRLDRLETAGLVRREPDPADRRGLQIVLTSQGLELVDLAIVARLQDAQGVVQLLTQKERQSLEPVLRKLLGEIEMNVGKGE